MPDNERIITVQRTAKHFFRTRRIWQYDVGHVLRFNDFDLPEVFQVHFGRSVTGESTTQIGTDGACALPDMYAQNSGVVYAWVYVADAVTGLTKELIEIPVEARGAITNQEPTPVQQSTIDQAIAALNKAVEDTQTAQQAAEDAAESVKNASATAETLSPGSPATVVVEDVEGVKTFRFGIPEGQKGETGDRGPQGEQGIQGLKGDKGDTGEQGPKGDRGEKGETGATGATGPKGDKGDQGIQGIQGPKGDTGEKGDKGDTGETGPKGEKGDPGEVTQAELDALAINKADVIISSASGAIASFSDGADGMPVKELTVDIEPVQDLHGYDSPWPGGGSANKWDEETESGALSTADGSNISNANTIRTTNFIPVVSGESYYVVCPDQIWVLFYNSEKTVITDGLPDGTGKANNARNFRNGYTMIIPAGCEYIRWYFRSEYGTTYNHDTALNNPATVTTYSPYSNVCPISGWTGAKVTRVGKNLLDKSQAHMYNQYFIFGGNLTTVDGTLFLKAGTYTISVSEPANMYLEDRNQNRFIPAQYSAKQATFTNPIDQYCKFSFQRGSPSQATSDNYDYQLELGSTATAYEPYQGQTYSITLPSEAGTVYGGELTVNEDGSGVLTVDKEEAVYSGTDSVTMGETATYRYFDIGARHAVERYSTKAISNWLPVNVGVSADKRRFQFESSGRLRIVFPLDDEVNTVEELNALLAETPLQVVLEITSPQTYTLTASQVTTLLGTNNVWADAGDVEITYRADTKLYIDNKITQAIAAALNA